MEQHKPATAFGERYSLASPTGATLNLYVRRADAPARAVIQINHGLAEHAGRYARFADFLAAHGFHAYAHDHRGHGGTTAPDAPPGRFAARDGGAKVIADVEAVHDLIARRHPDIPVVIFGHSMGGVIALRFVQRHSARLRGAAIWNPVLPHARQCRAAQALLAWERFRLGSDVPSRLMPRLTFRAWARAIPDRRTPFDWLSRDEAEIAGYMADRHCGWDASVSLWQDLLGLTLAGMDGGGFDSVRRDLPFDLVGGDADPATDHGRTVARLTSLLQHLGFSNLVSRIYAGTRHESLNELNRNIIMQDFAEWLDRIVE
jgi:alpha-beta hydrolase superfamily lysophospholipase